MVTGNQNLYGVEKSTFCFDAYDNSDGEKLESHLFNFFFAGCKKRKKEKEGKEKNKQIFFKYERLA